MTWLARTAAIAVALMAATPAVRSADVLSQQPGFIDRGAFGAFLRSLNVRPYGYAVIADPTGRAPSKLVERFEVRAGDCHFNGAWSDCRRDRERSELWEQGRRNPRGSSAWYGWSFFVPKDWPDVWPTKTVLGQFHQHRGPAVWMFLNHNGGLVLDDQVFGRTRRYVPLIMRSEFAGRWHRIVVHAKWKRGPDGFFRVWINEEKKFDYSGPTMTLNTVYFRYGVYRSFVSRYRQRFGVTDVPAQIAYFNGVKRARSAASLK